MNYKKATKKFFKKTKSKATRYINKPLLIAAALLSIVVIYGLANFYTHQDKTYSNSYLAQNDISNLSSDELAAFINNLMNETYIELSYKDQKEFKSAKDLGIYFDENQLINLAQNKNLLGALRPWFIKSSQNLTLNVDYKKLEKALAKFKNKSFEPAKNAEFTVKDNKLLIKKEKQGFGLDWEAIGSEILDNLSVSFEPLSKQLEVTGIEPEVTEEDIKSLSETINQKINNDYSISADGQVETASKRDIASWLRVVKSSGETPALDVDAKMVNQYVKKIASQFTVSPTIQVTSVYKSGKKSQVTTKGKNGRGVTNIDSISEDMINKLKSGDSYKGEFTFNEIDFRKVREAVDDTLRKATYTYDVAVWGSVQSSLASFKSLAAQTLADSRGWPAGGVSFQEVASGGNFTLVLAEPSRVASAAPICSSAYSCRAGRNVIINDDRWRLATPSWNSAGGSLRDYRHMVVNHEVGHWLGFGHRYCSGAGQLAPVMQQQSISLQGCKFNPWPIQSELSSL
ncbi:MAG TPA: DUF3152 domain-containing protein [Candidatus Saccharimonadales bacterium]|nr:DUF3152 domain-containing protein [Candidatus Saccharimonadales bacterium]